MTRDRDIERVLEHWLIDGVNEMPDRVYQSIFDHVEHQPQALAPRLLRRPPQMNGSLRWIAAAAAVLLVAAVGFAVVGRQSQPGVIGASPTPTGAPTESFQTPDASIPSASPDASGPLGGGSILAQEEGSDGALGVYKIDAGNGERTLVGTLPAKSYYSRPYSLQWTADHRHVLITADGFTRRRVRTVDSPTAAADDITFVCCPPVFQKAGDLDLHSWIMAPQGDRLAGLRKVGISATVPGQPGGLAVEDAVAIFDVESAAVRILPLPSGTQLLPWNAPWSPDGTTLAVAGCNPCNNAERPEDPPTAIQHQHLFLVPVDGRPVRDLLDVTGATFGDPAWSPDGSTISITYTRCQPRKGSDCPDLKTEVQTIDVSTGARSVLAAFGSGAVWSPDGRRIAFSDAEARWFADASAVTGVFVMNIDGTNQVRLADGSTPRWSPDSQWLLYDSSAPDGEGGDLWVVNADGGEPRLVGAYQAGVW